MGESMEGLGRGVLEMIGAGLALPDDALSLSRSWGVEHLSPAYAIPQGKCQTTESSPRRREARVGQNC